MKLVAFSVSPFEPNLLQLVPFSIVNHYVQKHCSLTSNASGGMISTKIEDAVFISGQ